MNGRKMLTVCAAITWLATANLVLPGPAGGDAAAQGFGMEATSGSPIEVYADAGIEWNQTDQKYIARGNARAVQGSSTVYGDTLIAYYEDLADGTSEIYRMDAIGNVRIVSPGQTAFGEKGVYDVRQGILVLTGGNLRMVTEREIITARDSLEYYEMRELAVARGDARARPADDPQGKEREVRGDVLAAHFVEADASPAAKAGARDENGGSSEIDRMEAFGDVVVRRPGEIAQGDRGVYRPRTDIANLWGNVRITRGRNQLNGEKAEVNFATGVSRLISSETDRDGPVRALIVPERSGEPESRNRPAAQNPARTPRPSP